MAKLTNEDRVIRQIIKAYGPTVDLKGSPEVFIEIVRKYAFEIADIEPGTPPDGGVGSVGPSSRISTPDGGTLPGGVGPVGPTSHQFGPRIEDLMKEILKLQRQVAKLTKSILAEP